MRKEDIAKILVDTMILTRGINTKRTAEDFVKVVDLARVKYVTLPLQNLDFVRTHPWVAGKGGYFLTPSIKLVMSLLRYKDKQLIDEDKKSIERGELKTIPEIHEVEQAKKRSEEQLQNAIQELPIIQPAQGSLSRRDVLAEQILVIAIQEPGANAEDYKHMISNCYMLADEFIQQGEEGQADDE